MARRIMSDYGICDLCENKMPLIDFPVNNDPADDLSSERICSVQSGVDISNPELFDSLENLLNRMTILANELEFPTFRTKCSDVLRVLYGSANCPKISADCFFIIPTIDFNAVFVNPDVILCCEDGSLHFMRHEF
jgi:hypothetical protein